MICNELVQDLSRLLWDKWMGAPHPWPFSDGCLSSSAPTNFTPMILKSFTMSSSVSLLITDHAIRYELNVFICLNQLELFTMFSEAHRSFETTQRHRSLLCGIQKMWILQNASKTFATNLSVLDVRMLKWKWIAIWYSKCITNFLICVLPSLEPSFSPTPTILF